MYNFFKNAYFNKLLFRWGLLPAICLAWAVFSSGVYYLRTDISPTVVSVQHNTGFERVATPSAQVVTGTFTAKENYLGIMSLDFGKTTHLVGSFTFKLKESGAEKWTVENGYNLTDIYYISEFPFGFPIINDSKSKSYDFRIVFDSTTSELPLEFHEKFFIVSKYKFPLSTLKSLASDLFPFLISKLKYSLLVQKQLKHLVLYFTPFFIMVLCNLVFEVLRVIARRRGKEIKQKYQQFLQQPIVLKVQQHAKYHLPHLFVIFPIYISLESMLVIDIYSLHLLAVVTLWVAYLWYRKLSSTTSFILSAYLSTLLPIFLIFNFPHISEKLTAYIFLFLTVACVHSISELRKSVSDQKRTASRNI